MSGEDDHARMAREIAAMAAADLRLRNGRSRSGIPKTKLRPDIDPARLAAEAVPGIALWASAREEDPAAAASRLGGYPNALSAAAWPMVAIPPGWEDSGPAPMSFIAQVELPPLRALHPLARHLPAAGALLFFLDEFRSAEGLNGDPYCRPCRVLHVEALDRPEGVRPPPLAHRSHWSHHEIVTGYMEPKPGYAADCYPASLLRPMRGLSWRRPGFSDMAGLPFWLNMAADPAAARWSGQEQGNGAYPPTMFGLPASNMVRGDDLGDYPGILDYVPGAVPDPRRPGLAPPDDPWVLLLQVPSTTLERPGGERVGQMLWMDAGYLCFFLRRSALEAQDWSAAVAVLDG